MPTEVRILHTYPAALGFLRKHGPDTVAVLHELLLRAEPLDDGRLVVRVSTRDVARHLGFLSKDSAHRRIRQLRQAGVVELLPANTSGAFTAPSYLLHLDSTGISVVGAGQHTGQHTVGHTGSHT
jgi:hypothetical protein